MHKAWQFFKGAIMASVAFLIAMPLSRKLLGFVHRTYFEDQAKAAAAWFFAPLWHEWSPYAIVAIFSMVLVPALIGSVAFARLAFRKVRLTSVLLASIVWAVLFLIAVQIVTHFEFDTQVYHPLSDWYFEWRQLPPPTSGRYHELALEIIQDGLASMASAVVLLVGWMVMAWREEPRTQSG